MDILDESIEQTRVYYNQPTKYIINQQKYIELLHPIQDKFKTDLFSSISENVCAMLFDQSNKIAVIFYYFVFNYLQKKRTIVNNNENIISNLYFLLCILLETKCNATMYELKIMEDYTYLDFKYIYLNTIVEDIFEQKASEIKSDIKHEYLEIITQSGSGRHYDLLNELLEKVIEPRHDFGKNRTEDISIRRKFNKEYTGNFDGLDYPRLIEELKGLMANETNPFFTKNKISLEKMISSEYFESNLFCYFHNFITYSREPENSSPQLFKYIKLNHDRGGPVLVSSVYNLGEDLSKMERQQLSIEGFSQTVFETNHIKFHMDDMTPTAQIRDLYPSLPEMSSAASLWDPNSKHDILPEENTDRVQEILNDTFLQIENRSFPKRVSIRSGRLSLTWGVVYRPEPKQLEITVNVFDNKDLVFDTPLRAIIPVPGISVAEISKLMYYIENKRFEHPPAHPSTTIILNELIKNIIDKDIKKVAMNDKKNILFALLLDFKITGDWGQSNWADQYNKSEPENKCMLVTKDKLCGLESILIGNPTLVSNVNLDDDDKIANKMKKSLKVLFSIEERDLDHIRSIISDFNFTLFQGNVNGYSNAYITSVIRSCYSKIYDIRTLSQSELGLTSFKRLTLDNLSEFNINQLFIFDERTNTIRNSIIEQFNRSGEFIISKINRSKPMTDTTSNTSNTADIAQLFDNVKNMDKFCTLIKELNIFLKNVPEIYKFLYKSFYNFIALFLMLINSTLGTFAEALVLVEQKYEGLEVPRDQKSFETEKAKYEQRNDPILSLLEIKKNIIEGRPLYKEDTKFQSRPGMIQKIIINFCNSLHLLNEVVLLSNINTLFGGIYCKIVDDCSYFDNSVKLIIKNNLYNAVFNQAHDSEAHPLNISNDIPEKLKIMISIWICLLTKYPDDMGLLQGQKSKRRLLIIEVNSIIEEMKESLYIRAELKSQIERLITELSRILPQ
jgi:hypothetical protein